MSSSGRGLSCQAARDSALDQRPTDGGRLDETELRFSTKNDCHNFHELPKKLSTGIKLRPGSIRGCLVSSYASAISARRGTDPATASLSRRAQPITNRFLSQGAVLFMSILIAQLFASNSALLRSSSWPREAGRSDSGRQSNQLTWSTQSAGSEFDSSRSQLIPSARYIYTYPNQARKRVRAPTSAWNGDRIRLLHDQLNQLKQELDQELGRGFREEPEVADSVEVETREESANKRPTSFGKIELGSPCLSTSFCQKSIRNSQCNLEKFTCDCLNEHVKLNSTTCLAPALLGFECQLDDQCRRRVPESICRAGKCSCQSENSLAYKRNKCLKASKLNDYCLLDGQCQLSDRHSFCRWRIQSVYGTCKCPPNYKLIPDQHNELKCAPRLGDTCLSDFECSLATPNSVCRHLDLVSTNRKWSSSSASNRSCTCDTGFSWSDDMLRCLQLEIEVPNVVANVVAAGKFPAEAAAKEQQDSHKYELLDVNGGNSTQAAAGPSNTTDELEVKLVPMDSSADTTAAAAATATTTTTAATTTTTTAATTASAERPAALNESLAQQEASRTFRMVSLGKACKWRQECQARDPNSDCIEGVCECLAPSPKCRASSRGCHPNTFQCRSGQCISWYFVCDQFRNCDDGSDEDDCKPGSCPPEAFQCHADGQCLTRGRVCDGQRDCLDGSDEFGCAGAGGLAKANQTSDKGNCPPEAFACANGQCLPGYVFCNAVEDCADGSDEDELACERTSSALTLAAANDGQQKQKQQQQQQQQHQQAAAAASTSAWAANQSAELNQTSAARRNKTSEAESPLIRTDRASIERLMASLGLSGAKWRPKTSAEPTTGQTSRRSRLMSGGRRLEERRRPTETLTGRQILVKHQRHGHGVRAEAARLECPASAFTCRNGKCRSSAILCSGVDGCGDNSDEDHCEVCQCEPPGRPPTSSRATNSRRHNGWLRAESEAARKQPT